MDQLVGILVIIIVVLLLHHYETVANLRLEIEELEEQNNNDEQE
jgi:hypothetical protein